MLNKQDLEILLDIFPKENVSDEKAKVYKKLEVLHQQLELQEEFQNRSIEIRKKMDELEDRPSVSMTPVSNK